MALVVKDGNQTDIKNGLTVSDDKVLSVVHADIVWPDLQTSSNFSCRMSSSFSIMKYRWVANSNRILKCVLFSSLINADYCVQEQTSDCVPVIPFTVSTARKQSGI